MNCPTCSEVLAKNKDYYYCVNDDGVLISSRHLRKHDKLIHNEEVKDDKQDTIHEINCPNCRVKMHKADYDSSGIIIDTCMNCHYRWLDSGELTKIKTFKPTFSPEDLLYLESVNTEIAKLSSADMENQIPGYATGLVSSTARGYSAGDSKQTLGWIGGGLIFGTVRTIIKGNWAQKVVLLIAYIVFGLLIWFIAGEINNTFQ